VVYLKEVFYGEGGNKEGVGGGGGGGGGGARRGDTELWHGSVGPGTET